MIETEQLSEEELKVTTKNPTGTYEYIFEKCSFSWILREKFIDGEKVEVTGNEHITQGVRQAVKDEAYDENGGILDNLDIVTSNQGALNIKNQDTLAVWGEELARQFLDDEEMIRKLANDSHYNERATCYFCNRIRYCRNVDDKYMCCTDCEKENPQHLQINRSELKVPQ